MATRSKTTTVKAASKKATSERAVKTTATTEGSAKKTTTRTVSKKTASTKAEGTKTTTKKVATSAAKKTASTRASQKKAAVETKSTPRKTTPAKKAATKKTTTKVTPKVTAKKAAISSETQEKTTKVAKKSKTASTAQSQATTKTAKTVSRAKTTSKAKPRTASSGQMTNKALKEAAELAPLVQQSSSGQAKMTTVEEAQEAVEYLMETMGKDTDEERVVIDGVIVPTRAELLAMPDSDYMNERQQAFFKRLLREREKQLQSNAGETTEHLRDNTVVPDPADRATIEEEHALELRTRDRERKLLKKVQEALQRLEKGEYGFCEETGDPIGIPRLLARPTATLSLEAQQRRELRQKLYGN